MTKAITSALSNVDITFKPIKHLYLRIERDSGRVKISAPKGTKMRAIETFLREKSHWILQKQRAARKRRASNQPPPGSIKLWGEQVRLQIERGKKRAVTQDPPDVLRITLLPGDDEIRQEQVLDQYYRDELSQKIKQLAPHWEHKLKVSANEYRVKKMRTRWGSCNIPKQRIWLNLWLAEKPIEQLELVLVHELVHLIEPGHGGRFQALMTQHMPDWRDRDKALNLR
ncbi:M48 family metallopeptidase [Aequoribacter sp.]|uniref:M48 family metallopeptidase n=1 Tax=Aequoribacter sp. TaxID=2847771 RepID=UPI003F6977E8